jgi:hypothetical protein
LHGKVHFAWGPAERVNTGATPTHATFDELRERFIVGRLGEDLATFITVEDYVMDPTRNMESS